MAKIACRGEWVNELCEKLGIDPSKSARIAIIIDPNDALKADVTLLLEPGVTETINKLGWIDTPSRPER